MNRYSHGLHLEQIVILEVVAVDASTGDIEDFESTPGREIAKGYAVSVNVTNLAPAHRLDGEATAFVVWLINQDQPAVRAGTLADGEG